MWDSQASNAAVQRLEEFGKWLQAVSLSAAANGQRAEEAAVANTVAVLAMPSVSEAIEARASQDMMASLAAYNGAVLTGRFAEFDEAATADQANAAARHDPVRGSRRADGRAVGAAAAARGVEGQRAQAAEQNGQGEGGGGAAGGGAGAGGDTCDAAVTDAGQRSQVQRRAERACRRLGSPSAEAPRAPGWVVPRWRRMPRWGRWAGAIRSRDYESDAAGRERSKAPAKQRRGHVGLRAVVACRPTAQNDSPFMVSSVSWGPDTAVFDELAVPDDGQPEGFADEPERTLEQVDNRWVSPPVIGVDRGLSL